MHCLYQVAFLLTNANPSMSWRQQLFLVVVAVTLVASAINIALLAQDAQDWRSSRLCEAATSCRNAATSSPTHDLCDDLDEHLAQLFRMYSVSIPCAITKVVFILTTLAAHKSTNLPFLVSFRLESSHRARTSFFVWVTALALDTPPLCASLLRFVFLPPNLADFEKALYPTATAVVTNQMWISVLTLLTAVVPVVCAVVMIVRAKTYSQ